MNTTNFHWPTSRAAWAGLIILTAIGLYYGVVMKDAAAASTLIGLALSVLGIGSQASAIQKTVAVSQNNIATALENQQVTIANQESIRSDLNNIIENPALPGKSDADFPNFNL